MKEPARDIKNYRTDLSAALERHREKGAFRIASVADNTIGGAPLAHYAASGEGA